MKGRFQKEPITKCIHALCVVLIAGYRLYTCVIGTHIYSCRYAARQGTHHCEKVVKRAYNVHLDD